MSILKISNAFWLTLLIIIFSSDDHLSVGRLNSKQTLTDRSDLKYPEKYVGLDPQKVKLLGNSPLTKRLKALLKNRYDFLSKTWGPETPIEVKNNTFSAWACQQHNCSNTNFTIVVDFDKNVVYVGIREEENVKIYSEDGSKNTEVTNWANRTN